MSQYNFGVGTVVGKRTDIANTQVALFGVVQEWELDIDQKLVTLMGQFKDAVDVAPGERSITGKIKFAGLRATQFGNLLLGVNPTSAAGIDMVVNEVKVPATATYTVAAGVLYTEDLGVYYAATGVALQPVASAPTAGQYIPGVAGTGLYTLNASEVAAGLVTTCYMKSATDQFEIDVGAALMGSGPTVELNFSNPYVVGGVTKKLNLQVPAARISKMPMQLKNANYLVPEMDFTAFLSPAGRILTISMTE